MLCLQTCVPIFSKKVGSYLEFIYLVSPPPPLLPSLSLSPSVTMPSILPFFLRDGSSCDGGGSEGGTVNFGYERRQDNSKIQSINAPFLDQCRFEIPRITYLQQTLQRQVLEPKTVSSLISGFQCT